jgi:biopolymer transport protein ExbB
MITDSLPLGFILMMGKSPMELFHDGGIVMWPIILVSFVGFTVVIERILFIIRENSTREHQIVEKMLERVEASDFDGAIQMGKQSKDFIARIITYALSHKESSLSNAFIRASNQELNRFQAGMATLDTCITAAPLLGLLGTVTGMMNTFHALGVSGDVAAGASSIMGGIGEALIATACGLLIAIIGLIPYNYLNARTEEAKHEVSDASNALELILKRSENSVS